MTMPKFLLRGGAYQVEAAIAALHDDAARAEQTDWAQILAWYDDLVALIADPVRQDPAAVLGERTAGTPSAAPYTSSTATCPPPPPPTPRPPTGPRAPGMRPPHPPAARAGAAELFS